MQLKRLRKPASCVDYMTNSKHELDVVVHKQVGIVAGRRDSAVTIQNLVRGTLEELVTLGVKAGGTRSQCKSKDLRSHVSTVSGNIRGVNHTCTTM